MDVQQMEIMLATDCGSTTTKARLFRRVKDEWRNSPAEIFPNLMSKTHAEFKKIDPPGKYIDL